MSDIQASRSGPLTGLKVLEIAGIGPGPMCAMLLADLGATVLRIERDGPSDVGLPRQRAFNLVLRNREVIELDLKQPEARDLVLRLAEQADALIEGFRPGVMERLGLGPEVCLERNPRLVYGRITGWGQQGPLAPTAAHDLNYLALTGALHAIGRNGQAPTPPLALVGDYGGGALYLAFGLMSAIWEAGRSGKGQVVDAAIVDGVASLMTGTYGMLAEGLVREERGANLNDSGAPFYDSYRCQDGAWISVAPIESRFFQTLMRLLGIGDMPTHSDPRNWPEIRRRLDAIFLTRPRDAWCALLEGSDACFAPVLSMREAPQHPHNQARETFIEINGVTQPAPAPRFSRTPPGTPHAPMPPASLATVLAQWLPGTRT